MTQMMNQLKTIVLLGALSALLVGVGAALAPGWTWVFLALALAMNLGAWFWSDRMILAMHGARELEPGELPWLHEMVEELSVRAGLPKPKLYLVADPQPNAFATGRDPAHGAVAVTEGILELLSPRELRGVLAHELAHIQNRDVLVASIAAGVASAVSWLAHLAGFGLMGGGQQEGEGEERSPLAALGLLLLAPLGATLIQLGISRSREYLADETGARIAGDPEALASALLRLQEASEVVPSGNPQPATASLFIVNPLAGLGSLAGLFSTHPPIEERVNRLRGLAQRRMRGARWLEA